MSPPVQPRIVKPAASGMQHIVPMAEVLGVNCQPARTHVYGTPQGGSPLNGRLAVLCLGPLPGSSDVHGRVAVMCMGPLWQ